MHVCVHLCVSACGCVAVPECVCVFMCAVGRKRLETTEVAPAQALLSHSRIITCTSAAAAVAAAACTHPHNTPLNPGNTITSLSKVSTLKHLDDFLDENTWFLQAGTEHFHVHEQSELGTFILKLHVSRQQCGFVAATRLVEGVPAIVDALTAFVDGGGAAAVASSLSASGDLQGDVFRAVLADQFVEVRQRDSKKGGGALCVCE